MKKRVQFAQLSWNDVEDYLHEDIRVVIPLGATEEHAHLSLLTDTLVVDHVMGKACEQTGVLMVPSVPFGCSAFSINYPGTISLRTVTMCYIIEDIIDCLYRQGFRRLIFITGHGGNEVITGVLSEAHLDRPQLAIYYESAWRCMDQAVREIEDTYQLPPTEHAAWHEDFPFTRIHQPINPDYVKAPPVSPDFPIFPLNPRTAREHLGEGIVSGKVSLDHDTTQELLKQCVQFMINYINRIPKTKPSN